MADLHLEPWIPPAEPDLARLAMQEHDALTVVTLGGDGTAAEAAAFAAREPREELLERRRRRVLPGHAPSLARGSIARKAGRRRVSAPFSFCFSTI